jgi:hypothetical protein
MRSTLLGFVAATCLACSGGEESGTEVDGAIAFDEGVADAETSIDDAPSDAGTDAMASGAWLTVKGNRILLPDGKPFHGRGANLHDTRSCNACTSLDPDEPGLERWADELLDHWKASFVRFDLEAYAADDGYRKQWKSLGVDSTYLADVEKVVTHMTGKPGVYVMVTLFQDPAIKGESADYDSEWPTDAALPLYEKIVETFHDDPKVLFGLTNEPHGPADKNAELAARYAKAIAAIRAIEAKYGPEKHVVVVQAPQSYARDVSYFVTNPLAGENIAYEIHPYNHSVDFDKLITQPAKKLPLIIGEYGPATVGGTELMNDADIAAMWPLAKAAEVPHIAWNFHQRCPPNLLQDTAADGCGLSPSTGYAFPRTPWGDLLHDYLATPW